MATALADPTRGAIVLELNHAGELTATQLARRLGQTPNNVYHHMRVLLQHGVVDPPRVVPGETYVEKYYRLRPETRAAIRLDPLWLDRAQSSLTAEDRKSILVSLCLTMAHMLRQAARRYEEMDAETLDGLTVDQQLVMMSIDELSRERLQFRLEGIREVLAREAERFADEQSPPTDLAIMAALPALWDQTGEQDH